MLWGFWEPRIAAPPTMYRKDWSPRPMASVWKEDLIFKQWWI